jgi:hypothetical protein
MTCLIRVIEPRTVVVVAKLGLGKVVTDVTGDASDTSACQGFDTAPLLQG